MVGSRVYVGGLPYGCRERDLERFFKGYGRTRDILLKKWLWIRRIRRLS